MGVVLYIHGFLSSPGSEKAVQTHTWLQQRRPQTHYLCPHLAPYPKQSIAVLEDIINNHRDQKIGIIGSSLGGYYATYLTQRYQCKAVLINPAVSPYRFMKTYLGQELKNFHTADTYQLNESHIAEMQRLNCEQLEATENIWLMAQTGDETLDYRDAVAKYVGCKQTIEEGGDHSFTSYQQHLPSIIKFLDL